MVVVGVQGAAGLMAMAVAGRQLNGSCPCAWCALLAVELSLVCGLVQGCRAACSMLLDNGHPPGSPPAPATVGDVPHPDFPRGKPHNQGTTHQGQPPSA